MELTIEEFDEQLADMGFRTAVVYNAVDVTKYWVPDEATYKDWANVSSSRQPYVLVGLHFYESEHKAKRPDDWVRRVIVTLRADKNNKECVEMYVCGAPESTRVNKDQKFTHMDVLRKIATYQEKAQMLHDAANKK